ncbi:metallophosphoesterase family protein [Sphingomonas sabuli]|uniref:Metallophosphoesterase family protein n=1 Tax=Sphingomonas sabuli TaxID=2764186 RepID=A0A7G9L458_9SPHN|nr:metallophosphoesterase family protein [Sphingomonas sabuli]QNM83407.1 metallophosphoesterase family protein [Sphingomonas sabuli]
MKIAVLSDIHSAAEHFADALEGARSEGFDRLIILGDLFTYGPEPRETLRLTQYAVERDGAILITGNHDVLYRSGAGADAYRAKLPDWIRESVAWTVEQLGGPGAVDALPWHAEWTAERLLVSHANPFGFPDWTYLNGEAAMQQAAEVLQSRGFDWGIFGHVHRFRGYRPADRAGGVYTVGSIGQPRDREDPRGQWAMVTAGPEFSIEQRWIDRSWDSTIRKLRATGLSAPTKERLCQFFQ